MNYTSILLCLPLLSFGGGQDLQPTETEALVEVKVMDFENNVKEGEQILLEGMHNQKVFTGITDASGSFSLLIPEGDTYLIRIKNFSDKIDYNKMSIPAAPGKYTSQLTIQFETPKVYTLKDVYFDTGKSTLRPESTPALNELLKVMQLKKHMHVEIAGHTDNIGDDHKNMVLSESRAEAVRQFLVNKGIDGQRIKAKGYGETEPVADNSTTEGRQKNRRTEVRILGDQNDL